MSVVLTPAQLADLFGEIVEYEVAVDENFFEVGGNSILALDLIEVLRERSGIQLQLIDVFRAPTPEELAHALRERAAQAIPEGRTGSP